MSIETTYKELILEQIIKTLLENAETPSVTKITNEFNTFVDDHDLTQPIFSANDFKVESNSAASASAVQSTSDAVLQELTVSYKHLLGTSNQIILNFDRWRDEAQLLEQRLNDLQNRVENLLLISEDTAGYLNYVYDSFVDASKVELSETTAAVDPTRQAITVATSSVGATRVDTSFLKEENIEFVVLTKTGLVSQVSAERSTKLNALSDINTFWQDKVFTNKPVPVSVEFKIDFTEQVTVSKLTLDLHMSNSSASVQCTPMYSDDSYTWSQLPTTNFTLSVSDKAQFVCSPVTARYIKIIMTKMAADSISNGIYMYEFGVDEIAFFNEGFTVDTGYDFVSKPLFVNNAVTGTPQEFNKVVLDVCEDVPDGTEIRYYVQASNTSTVPIDEDAWIAIDPATRKVPTYPTSLDLGALSQIEISGIGISYDITEATTALINPDKDFTLVASTSGTTAITDIIISSAKRYDFINSNDRILDYQLSADISYADKTLEVWRNVRDTSSSLIVREYLNGWGFEEPHYKTTVKVDNADGITIDFGTQHIIIDGVSQSGKITVTYGNHSIMVHKDNWKYVDSSGVTDLTTLKAADSLYPFNHRYLVEGFVYPGAYSTTDEQIYKGFDIVAEYLMKEASVFDLLYNTKKDDYTRFAIDLDAEDTAATIDGVVGTKDSSKVFLLKVNEEYSDFTNEKFLIRFKSVDTLYKYLRLKAVFQTTDSSLVPRLDSYRIKISS